MGRGLLCVKSKVNDSGGVMLSMEDTGKGVETKTSTGYSIRSSPQNRMAWGWACRFAARLSRHMMAGYGLSPTHPRAPSFSSSCSLTPRCLLVLHDERNRAISRPGLTSAFGTTCRRHRFMSAIGGKADIAKPTGSPGLMSTRPRSSAAPKTAPLPAAGSARPDPQFRG